MKRAFTLLELVVAVAVLALISSFAGAIFSVSVDSHRAAMANAEIMQKLRAITDQLNADFAGLRKDGEIFVIWSAVWGDPNMNDPNRFIRFDRIMFFANGDFQTYRDGKIRGDVARICYMLANIGQWGNQTRPYAIRRERRVLSRSQHILTSNADLDPWLDPNQRGEEGLDNWRNAYEYDRITMQQWKNMLWETDKKIALSVIMDVDVDDAGLGGGATVEPLNPAYTHMLLCEGMGEFKVQGWYEREQRWVPELADGDFDGIPEGGVPGVLYPHPLYGAVQLGGEFWYDPDPESVEGQAKRRYLESLLNEEHFNEIPGLGRALKFTFTLYDSRGIIREGRTFTHIVYLDS
ncbi:MAG TPA: prepilin-type N-terminal cleavage/methylation domain-containing protein [Sedimentisphaerales bacterium]|nr:prepilin-type N-terminal cleavage/methylation domain-containing protein [Sedimentisphaerales bacterium]